MRQYRPSTSIARVKPSHALPAPPKGTQDYIAPKQQTGCLSKALGVCVAGPLLFEWGEYRYEAYPSPEPAEKKKRVNRVSQANMTNKKTNRKQKKLGKRSLTEATKEG